VPAAAVPDTDRIPVYTPTVGSHVALEVYEDARETEYNETLPPTVGSHVALEVYEDARETKSLRLAPIHSRGINI
jgi:5-formaminoimidazole-4-carboxamide-1-beta-D-ribofuranosyl 5'-monophosphate synthetase